VTSIGSPCVPSSTGMGVKRHNLVAMHAGIVFSGVRTGVVQGPWQLKSPFPTPIPPSVVQELTTAQNTVTDRVGRHLLIST
jgi:hypothetical protein